jgi:iron(III) transport system permease protein
MRFAPIVLAVPLAALVLPPLGFLVFGSLVQNDRTIGLAAFHSLFAAPAFLHGLVNSVGFALASAALAIGIGGSIAWLIERTDAPFPGLVRLTTVAALATPGILYAGAWLALLGRAGPLNVWWRQLTGSPLVNVYSLPGMILVEGLVWSPMVVLLAGAAFRNLNPELEEAARMAGANAWQVFRRITLKLAIPALVALAMLIFIRSLEAFEVPALLGIPGRVPMLATSIYQTLHAMPPDLASASALSVVLLALMAALLWLYARLTRSAARFASITGKSFRPRRAALGRWRPLAGAAIVLNFGLTFALPVMALLWLSLLPFQQLPSVRALHLLTLGNYGTILRSQHTLGMLGNTLLVAATSASAAILLAAGTAWLRVRRAPGAWLLDALASLPLTFPGIVLGVAVMQLALNLPGTLSGLYGTVWVLAWAFTINALPYGVRYSHAGMLQLHAELEEAAAMSGASTFASLRRIVIPLLTPALSAGWIFTFLLCMRALSLPVLLSGPNAQTLAVALFDLSANGQAPELAALGLLWTGATILIVLVATHPRRLALGPSPRP